MREFLRTQHKKCHAHHQDARWHAAAALPPETSGVSSQTIAYVRIADSRGCGRASVPAASTRTASIDEPANQIMPRTSCLPLRRQWKHLHSAWMQQKLRAQLPRYSAVTPKDHREAFRFPASALRGIGRQTSRDTHHKARKIPGISAPRVKPARQELLAKPPPVPGAPRQL